MVLKYPKHFYEPIRIEIAVNQMQHDFRKLLPSLTESEFEKIDKDIASWFEGEKFELEPVHDFWNFFGGFARGLKLKSLLYWVTAENVIWQKKMVPVDKVVITWDFPHIDFLGKAPYRAIDVRKKLFKPEKKADLEFLRRDSDFHSTRYAPRDQFPVILFYDNKGETINHLKGYYILEGNRRTIRAIVTDKKYIPAYVGKFKTKDDKWPKNYWLRTGLLRDLIFLSICYDKENDETAFHILRNFYQLLLRDFDIARIATIDKSFKNFETNDHLLHELMMEDMK